MREALNLTILSLKLGSGGMVAELPYDIHELVPEVVESRQQHKQPQPRLGVLCKRNHRRLEAHCLAHVW